MKLHMNIKPIAQFADRGIPPTAYKITDRGQVWSCESEQYVKPYDNGGYQEVDLKFEGVRVKGKLHRLVAHAFLAPPTAGQTEVNHIDGNRKNNTVENLEWCSHAENIQHRNNVLQSDPGGKAKKPVVLVWEDSPGEVFIAMSHKDAIEKLGCSAPAFYKALSTDREIHGTLICEIQNPEVVRGTRNQVEERGGEAEPKAARAEGQESAEDGEGQGAFQSEAHKALLAKWSQRGHQGHQATRA